MPHYRMFIDDTGNVSNSTSNHPQNRFAGIVGVIMNLDYLRTRFEPSFEMLKQKHFGRIDGGKAPILHLRRMKKAEGPFACLSDASVREAWQNDCFRMYERAQYTVIAVCVDKIDFYSKHPSWGGSVYELLVGNAIERYFYFLRGSGGIGDVMAEAANQKLDRQLKELYRKFYESGTDHIQAQLLKQKLSSKEIKIQPKADGVAGLQLADLLASTCFAHCRRIYAAGSEYDAFAMRVAELMEAEKFYRNRHGNPDGYGRIWRP